MKRKTLLIIYDAEGLPGIKTMKDICADYNSGKQTKKLFNTTIKTLNKIIEGAEKASFKKIIILDWHDNKNTVPRQGLKKLRSTKLTILAGLPENFKSSFRKATHSILIGMHGKNGSRDGKVPMHVKEFKGNGPHGLGHVFGFTFKHLFLNGKSIGESTFLYHMCAEQSIPVIFLLGTPSATKEIKFQDSRIIIVNNTVSYEAIGEIVKTAFQKSDFTTKKVKYNSMSIELKKSNNPEIDKFKILKDREDYIAMHSKKVIIKNRKIWFKPTTKTPFLETFYLILLENYNG